MQETRDIMQPTIDAALKQIEQLTAERDRYKAALEKIRDNYQPDWGPDNEGSWDDSETARKALGPR